MGKCYVSEIEENSYKEGIRQRVCQRLPAEFECKGKYYCVLHFPNNKKHEYTNFNLILQSRLDDQENDFRQVYFSNELYLPEYKFTDDINFIGAKFRRKVFLGGAIFEKDASFGDTTFEDEAYFFGCTFNRPNFCGAIFRGFAYFGSMTINDWADFNNVTFLQNANFADSVFNQDVFFGGSNFVGEVQFSGIKFEQFADFSGITFSKDVDFGNSKFSSEVILDGTEFQENVNFRSVIFKDYVSFADNREPSKNRKAWIDFQNIRFEDANHISFHSFFLRPSYFVNADSRKFVFTDVSWGNVAGNSFNINVEAELKNLEERGIKNSKQLFKIACRQLAENAESNNRFEEASNFRRLAMETEWLEKKEKISNWTNNLFFENEKLKRRFGVSIKEEDKPNPPTNSFGILRRSGDFIIHGLYRLTSYYGESWSWASGILLLGVFAAFPLIYTQTNFQTCPKEKPLAISINEGSCKAGGLTFWNGEATAHSLTTATLQNVEYRKPISFWSETWVILEKIFVPLQAALLALAIRRKFMR